MRIFLVLSLRDCASELPVPRAELVLLDTNIQPVGRRVGASISLGARRMQEILDGDSAYSVRREGRLADYGQLGRGEGARKPTSITFGVSTSTTLVKGYRP